MADRSVTKAALQGKKSAENNRCNKKIKGEFHGLLLYRKICIVNCIQTMKEGLKSSRNPLFLQAQVAVTHEINPTLSWVAICRR